MVLGVATRRAGGDWLWSHVHPLLVGLLMLALSLVAAWALYRLVEVPMMARLAGSRGPARVAAGEKAAEKAEASAP